MSDTDLELLARYTQCHAEDAFSEVVRRHLDLVHSAALRQVRSPHLAEEVAQSTFIKLARQAHRLASDTILTAWLYQVTRREAIDVVRREARRQLREQIATEMNAMNATAADWTQIEPLLDEAMHALDDTERTAVLLRFFENKSLREVGQTLGTTDDTARKRVNRAVERLREFFSKRGVTVGASGLAVVISANAVQAAPVGLAGTVVTAAVTTGSAALLTSTIITMKLFKTQLALILSAIFLSGAGHSYIWNRTTGPVSSPRAPGEVQTLTTNEMLYQEMLAAAPIAGEVEEGHPTRTLWQDRQSTLFQAGYIEAKEIPLRKVLSGKGASWKFFTNFQSRFYGVQLGLRGLNSETPPIAMVTARKTDLGPTGAIEQFIRNYDPEKQ